MGEVVKWLEKIALPFNEPNVSKINVNQWENIP